jgi:Ca2+-transporting ATPase
VPLSDDERGSIALQNDQMAGAALRVLGCAYAETEDPNGEVDGTLTWLGLVGMTDPLRPGVKETIKAFHRAGIDTVMITGDQSLTAGAMAAKLQLSRSGPIEVVDSTHLANDNGLTSQEPERATVFARVSPAEKLIVVRRLQRGGRVVAMTGDGINDGPALKAADIGIAMGATGTEVAREVADVVLEEDDLQTLLVGIRQGRTIYHNIRKALRFLLSTNMSEIGVVLVGLGTGLGQPLSAMQLLWINLISDIFPGLALALEPPEATVMAEAPRDSAQPIISGADLGAMARESVALAAGALGAYAYGLERYGTGARASTMAFTSLTSAQLLHAVSCRSETASIFSTTRRPANPYLSLALIGSYAMQALTFAVPYLRELLGVTRLGLGDFAVIGAGTLIPFMVNEAAKGTSVRA